MGGMEGGSVKSMGGREGVDCFMDAYVQVGYYLLTRTYDIMTHGQAGMCYCSISDSQQPPAHMMF